METKQNSGHMFFFSTSMQKYRPKYTLLAYPQVIDYKMFEIFFLVLEWIQWRWEEVWRRRDLCVGCWADGLSSVQSHLAWFAMVLCLKAESLGVHKPSGWKNLLRSASSPKHCAESNVCLSQQWSVKAWDSKTRLMLHGPEKPCPLELGRQWRTKQDGKREAARTAGCRRCGGLEQSE